MPSHTPNIAPTVKAARSTFKKARDANSIWNLLDGLCRPGLPWRSFLQDGRGSHPTSQQRHRVDEDRDPRHRKKHRPRLEQSEAADVNHRMNKAGVKVHGGAD